MLCRSDLPSSFCFSCSSVKPTAEASFVNFVSFVLSGAGVAGPPPSTTSLLQSRLLSSNSFLSYQGELYVPTSFVNFVSFVLGGAGRTEPPSSDLSCRKYDFLRFFRFFRSPSSRHRSRSLQGVRVSAVMGKYLELTRDLVRRIERTRSKSAIEFSSDETRKHAPERPPAACARTIGYETNEVDEERRNRAECSENTADERNESNEGSGAIRRSLAIADERNEVDERSGKTAATGNAPLRKKYEERSVSHPRCPASEIPAKLLPPVRSRAPYVRQLPVVAPEFFEQLSEQRRSAEKAQQRQQRRPRKRRPADPKDYTTPFGAWLADRWRDPGPIGDLVCAFRQEPDESYPEHWQARLDAVQAHKRHRSALKTAVSRWKKECKKGSSSGRVGQDKKTPHP